MLTRQRFLWRAVRQSATLNRLNGMGVGRTGRLAVRRQYSGYTMLITRLPLRIFLGTAAGVFTFVTFKMNGKNSLLTSPEAAGWLREAFLGYGQVFDDVSLGLVDLFSRLTNTKLFSAPGSNGGPGGHAPRQGGAPVAPLDGGSDDDERGDYQYFIRKMIEVRNILKVTGDTDDLKLPCIVVIGSQSSGKSSVLEALVGHEFLPKGIDMVTRRPLELTLINSPSTQRDYGVFSGLGMGKIYDFGQVQKILTDLNAAVSDSQCVSSDPIQLSIYSSSVPDLSLVDLPGYVQVSNRKQPPILREKIAELCEKYIQEPNIILAISAADVDLANSEALKASRRVDPSGQRTIGVLTKMDLVDANHGASLLYTNDFPLQMGYVGVVCRPSDKREKKTRRSFEADYFLQNSRFFNDGRFLGVESLRRKMITALENSMLKSQRTLYDRISAELEDIRYQFKVEFNDRTLSAHSYVSQLLGRLHEFSDQTTQSMTKAQVRQQISDQVHAIVGDIFMKHIWTDDYAANPNVRRDALEKSISELSRLGVGRMGTLLIIHSILSKFRELGKTEPLSYHPEAIARLMSNMEGRLKKKSSETILQVENGLKPLKAEIEFTPEDWEVAKLSAAKFLTDQLQQLERRQALLKKQVGKRLNKYVEALASGEQGDGSAGANIEKARQIVLLNHRIKILKGRLSTTQAKECAVPHSLREYHSERSIWRSFSKIYSMLGLETAQQESQCRYSVADGSVPGRCIRVTRDPCQYECPETFLFVILDKFLDVTTNFIHCELVQDFCYSIPGEVSALDGSQAALEKQSDALYSPRAAGGMHQTLSNDRIVALAKENPKIKRHLELIERKEALERVRDQLLWLKHFEREPSDRL